MFWIVIFSLILIIAISTTARKLLDEKYSDNLKHFVKRSLIRIIVCGTIGLGGLILIYLCFAYPLSFSSGVVGISIIMIIVGVLVTLIFWIGCPSNSDTVIEKNKTRIKAELVKQNFIIDDNAIYFYFPCEIEIMIDSINKKVALCEYRTDKFTIFDSTNCIGFQVLEDSQVVENDSSGLGRAIVGGIIAGGAGAVVGALTKKDTKKYRTVDIRFVTDNTINHYRNIRLATVKNENGAYLYNSKYRTALNYANSVHSAIAALKT